jgi:4-amino-4-deoxy-L-arabinose transferase-like glycosyltransferase
MFNEQWGGQIGWLIPAAAIATVGGKLARWRSSRTDPARTGFILWGGWLATHVAVFNLSAGNLHPYYAVVIGPAIAALVGGGLAEWWRARGRWPLGADAVLAVAILSTAAVAHALLARTSGLASGLGAAILVVGLGAVVAVLLSSRLPSARRARRRGARDRVRRRSRGVLRGAVARIDGAVGRATAWATGWVTAASRRRTGAPCRLRATAGFRVCPHPEPSPERPTRRSSPTSG